VQDPGIEKYPCVVSLELGMRFEVGKLPRAVLMGPDRVLRSKGLVNHREHLESLVEAMDSGFESIQDGERARGALARRPGPPGAGASRLLANRRSRRSFPGRLGASLAGVATFPMLPVLREAAAAGVTELGDPNSCDDWRYCAFSGTRCGGCHPENGAGDPPEVPSLREDLSTIISVPEGRANLAQVPGAGPVRVSRRVARTVARA
jgi:hypothetical protein